MNKETKLIRKNKLEKRAIFPEKKGKSVTLDSLLWILEGVVFIWDIGRTMILVIVVAFVIRFYLIQPFYVEGQSMEPSFNNGEYLLIDEISYHFKNPERGDVIVFKPPINTYQNYIKRIIGLPGEEVVFGEFGYQIKKEGKEVAISEPYLNPETPTQGSGEIPIGEEQFFVMGDNRTASSDSRVFGPVNKKNITGKVWLYIKTAPWKTFSVLGKRITIPKIASIGKIEKPTYAIDE